MKIGIVGNGEDKFSPLGEVRAKSKIREILLLNHFPHIFISGHSPVGGIDIWGEEIAKELNYELDIKIPKQNKWDAEYGYKQRNLDIAKDSDILYIIVANKYTSYYIGQKFNKCYHCNTSDHIKSGACWTGKETKKLGKKVIYYIIKND